MSMTRPMEPEHPDQRDEIPAADAGRGAPAPAPGFGTGGEEPDRVDDGTAPVDAPPPAATPFRTPDPTEIGPADS